jgi:ATP-binding cassette subfamily C protein
MPRYGFSTAEIDRAWPRRRYPAALHGWQGRWLFDLPWMPLSVFVYCRTILGILTFCSALVLWAHHPHRDLHPEAQRPDAAGGDRQSRRSMRTRAIPDVIRAMGFTGRAVSRFVKLNEEHLRLQTKTSDITGTFAGISKVLRMILQSAVLGLGAYLTIKGDLTAGAIIAASVASARALAPVDLAISQWKGVVAARRSYTRLTETLTALDEKPTQLVLPMPRRDLKIEKITVAAPSSGMVVLSASAWSSGWPGTGIIGPSGGGNHQLAQPQRVRRCAATSARRCGPRSMAGRRARTVCRLSAARGQPA